LLGANEGPLEPEGVALGELLWRGLRNE
jgi:hypothetical protein